MSQLNEVNAQQLAGKDVDPAQLVMISSEISHIGEGLKKLENFSKIQDLLESQHCVSMVVPGDGSCALHSLIMLESGRPFTDESDSALHTAKVKSLRDEIARLWAEAIDDPLWIRLYASIVDTFDGPQVKAEVKREIKQEPASPRRTLKAGRSSVDLRTPPGNSAVKRELVEAEVTPPQKKKKQKSAADCMDLITPPRVEKVGSTRNAMRETADRNTRASVQSKMNAAVASSKPTAKAKAKAKAKASSPELPKKSPVLSKKKKSQAMVETSPPQPGGDGQDAPPPKQRKKKPQSTEPEPGSDSKPHSPESDEPKKKKRAQKREVKPEDRKREVLGSYLHRLHITWPRSQNYHNLHPVDQDAKACKKNRGWDEMKNRLLELKPPVCLTCMAMLKNRNFNMERLESLFQECGDQDVDLAWSDLQGILNQYADVKFDPLPDPADEVEMPEEEAMESVPEISVEDDTAKMIEEMRCIQLMVPGADGKLRPAICRACTTKKHPRGKIIDLTASHRKAFLKQHCTSLEHRQNLREWLEKKANPDNPDAEKVGPQKDEQGPSASMASCTGMSLTHDRHGKPTRFHQEIGLWAAHSNLETSLNRHDYKWSVKGGQLTLFHEKCEKVAPTLEAGSAPICKLCASVDRSQNCLKNAIRFATKYWLAKLLNARLFRSEDDVEQILEKIKATAIYKASNHKMDELLNMPTLELQSWVRTRWSRWPHRYRNDALTEFQETFVEPSLTVNVQNCTTELRTLTAVFSEKLVAGNLSEFSALCAKIALFVSRGKLAERPAIMGMVLQCMDAVSREDRQKIAAIHLL